MIGRKHAESWMEALRGGWVDGDPDAIGRLFTDDVMYRTSPYEEPLVGRDSVVTYWKDEMAGTVSTEVAFGEPLIDGDRVAVEWWAIVSKDGAETTDSGALILEFSGHLCSQLHEYWMLRDGRMDLPENYRILRGNASR